MNLFQKLRTFSTSFKIKTQYFIQDKLNKKRYLALAFFLTWAPSFAYYSYQNPDAFTLLLTKAAEKLSQV